MKRWGAEALGRWCLLVIVTGCGGAARPSGRVGVHDAFVFEAAAGGTAAGYAVIVNGTDSAEVLDSVTTPAAHTTTAHGTRQVNGLVSMVPLDAPTIAPHDSLVFQPGASHLMLDGLVGDLKDGERLVLTFWFHHAGPLPADAMVRAYGS